MAKPSYYKVTEEDGFVWYSEDDPSKAGADHDKLLKGLGGASADDPEVKKLLALADSIVNNSKATVEAVSVEDALVGASDIIGKHSAHYSATEDVRKKAAVAMLQGGAEPAVVQEKSGALYNHMLMWVGWKKDDEKAASVDTKTVAAIKALKKSTTNG